MKKISVFLTLLLCAPLYAAEPDYTALNEKVKEHLINLINIDTSQPEGRELHAARYIYKALNSHNQDWDLYQAVPGRANLISVIKGKNKNLKPLILLSHLDTVSAQKGWSKPPFRGILENGRIYGLGATDAKNYNAVTLTVFTWFKENNITPERDIILMATADEEAGSKHGLNWLYDSGMLDKYKNAYALNEGGSIFKLDNKTVYFIETSTKAYMDIKITASGSGGHSATSSDNAVYNLSSALKTLENFDPPPRLTPPARNFFEQIYPLENEEGRLTIDMLFSESPVEAMKAAGVMSEDSFLKTQLRDTITPTIISSGADANVSAQEASAVLNCRLLPDTNPELFVTRIRSVLEQNPYITIEVLESPRMPFPKPTGINTPLFESIERTVSKMGEDSFVLTGMIPASSDSEILRRLGINTYGLGTNPEEKEEDNSRSHAPDEYISVKELEDQLKFMLELVIDFTVKEDSPKSQK